MLDLDDPDIRISLSLAAYVSIRIGLGDRDGTSCPHPQKLAALSTRLRQHRTALGDAAVEFEQYGTGITIAAGQHGDRDRGKVAPADQRLDPYPAFQPRFQRADPFQPRSGAKGRRTWIANPCGSRFSASTVPPIASTFRRAIHNPIPK